MSSSEQSDFITVANSRFDFKSDLLWKFNISIRCFLSV